jgi:hypothetical protein
VPGECRRTNNPANEEDPIAPIPRDRRATVNSAAK